jgi:hypothetical protein
LSHEIISQDEEIFRNPEEKYGYIIDEKSNFAFGDENDGNIDYDTLAWYAHYRTADFVYQILRKVDRFRKDEHITELLHKINEATKRA